MLYKLYIHFCNHIRILILNNYYFITHNITMVINTC
nr:MAG TPA: hypothetical protein [Caudoviricetes sp.]